MPRKNELESGFEPATSENIPEVDFGMVHDYYCSNPLFVSPEIRGSKNVSGGTFGSEKRNMDEIDRAGFRGFNKKNFDEIDRAGFTRFAKRPMDEIDRAGFTRFQKRPMDEIDRAGFTRFVKRPMDEIDRAGFDHFVKRETPDELPGQPAGQPGQR